MRYINGILIVLFEWQFERLRLTDLEWIPEQPLGRAFFGDDDGEVFQYEGRGAQMSNVRGGAGELYYLRLLGCQLRVEVRTPLEQALSGYSLPPEVKDHSKHVLCPMPGTLISCSKSYLLLI